MIFNKGDIVTGNSDMRWLNMYAAEVVESVRVDGDIEYKLRKLYNIKPDAHNQWRDDTTHKETHMQLLRNANDIRVGDKVVGYKNLSQYSYTDKRMKSAIVKEIVDKYEIRIEILEHESDYCVGRTYKVDTENFKILELSEHRDFIIEQESKKETEKEKKLVPLIDPKVGDIITGKFKNGYGITNERMTKGKITQVRNRNEFVVKVLEHEDKEKIGDEHTVNTDNKFYLLESASSKTTTKKEIKEGSKVRLIADNPVNGFGPVHQGDIGIVIRVSQVEPEKITIKFDRHNNWNGYIKEVELVDSSTGINKDFKVGDIIKKDTPIGGKYTLFEVIEMFSDNTMRTKIIGNASDTSIGKEYTMPCDTSKYFKATKEDLFKSFSVGDLVKPADIVDTTSVYQNKHILGFISDVGVGTYTITVLKSTERNEQFLFKNIYGVEPKNIRYIRKATNLDLREYNERKEMAPLKSATPEYKEPIMGGIPNPLTGRISNPFKTTKILDPLPEEIVLTAPIKKIENKKEERLLMNINAKTFGLGNVGVDRSGLFKLSMLGLAIRNASGEWVVYNAEESVMVNVCDMVIDTKDMVFRLPSQTVEVGDLIVHNNEPVYVVEKGRAGRITVLNPATDKEETIVPQKNIVGFKFFIKIVSMLGAMGLNTADASNPMAMMMPLMMMNGGDLSGDGKGGFAEMLPMLMMSQMMGGQTDAASNPMAMMMPLMLMSGDKKSGEGLGMMEMLMFSQMMGGAAGANPFGNMFGAAPAKKAATKPATEKTETTSKAGRKPKETPALPAGKEE